ncbi:MAG: 3-deoxy-D-manno-octulosonic acid transferase, partial [Alphaproteobacteria bacterium]
RIGERFGRSDRARPPGCLVWVHAASIGEAQSALPLVGRIIAERPDVSILMTTGTTTSAELMARRLPAAVIHQFAPVDEVASVSRFLDHWRPQVGLIMESEIWPNLLTQAEARGVKLALVNARISPASFRRWRRVGPLARKLFRLFSCALAQSPEDLERLAALGAHRPLCPGNLKFATPPPDADPDTLAALRDELAGRRLWLAASTHPGEEEIVAEAHSRLSNRWGAHLTIVAPRHPDRGAQVATALEGLGHRTSLRSRADVVDRETAIYVADTIGEMGLWYRLADVVFMGGSLVRHGGQNPLEPAKLDCAIVSGPAMSNFERIAGEMREAGAMARVVNAHELADEVGRLLVEDGRRARMIAAARAYATGQGEVVDRVWEELAPVLADAVAPGTRAGSTAEVRA